MKYLFLCCVFILGGCTRSIIKIRPAPDKNAHVMFGEIPSREFKSPATINDSLKLKWSAEIHGSFPHSSVTVYDNYVFINDLSGRIFCFELNSGETIGELKYDGAVYTTPVIDEIRIIFAVAQEGKDNNFSTLVYYNFLKGKESNIVNVEGRILTQLIKVDKGIIFNTQRGKVFKFNLLGEKLWETDTESFTHSSPALGNGIILFGTDNGEIIALDAADGKILYRKNLGKTFFSGPTFDEGTAFIGNDNGFLYAIDPETGKVKWKFDSGSRITMTPCVGEDKVIIGNLSGELFALNKLNGTKIWEISTGGVLNVTPLITKNLAVVPDMDKKIYLVNLENGIIEKTINLSGRAKLTPVINSNLLFIGYDEGILEAYEFSF